MSLDLNFSDLNVLMEEDEDLLQKVNQTHKIYREKVTLHKLFTEQAQKFPYRVAVIDQGNEYTYQEIDQKSNKVAHCLADAGVCRNQPVAIMMERNIHLIIGILGILKAGGAYVPVDPGYPEKRIQYILKDTGCKVLVTQKATLEIVLKYITPSTEKLICLGYEGVEPIRFPIFGEADIAIKSSEVLPLEDDENSMAYIIYTSGSTGEPKGVVITHKAVLNTLFWMHETFQLSEDDVVAQKTSSSFTDSVWEIFWPLITGSKMSIINDQNVKDVELLYTWLDSQKITITQFVPALMSVFLTYIKVKGIKNPLPNLKWVFNGGEAIPVPLVRTWYDAFANAKIANIYGMTESAIYASYYIVEHKPNEFEKRISIGKPIANTQIYIMGLDGGVCPLGVQGEICIGGIGITTGYFGKPEITKNAFTSHPVTRQLLYKTGDLGFFGENGLFEYIGRKDDQVQVRGYRVELKEVERAVLRCSGIKQAVAVAKNDEFGQTEIVCYYTANDPNSLELNIREKILEYLPEYMVPSFFIQLKAMPLTPHGKIDRKNLPEYGGERLTKGEYIPPQNQGEIIMAQIWSDVLKVSQIGINDSFMELGGHSLKAMNLLSQIETQWGVKLSLHDIFSHNTVKELSAYIATKAGDEKRIHLKKSDGKRGYYSSSSAQKRIYALWMMEKDSIAYNMPGVLLIKGLPDKDKIQKILNILIQKYEIFRTAFEVVDNEIVQYISEQIEVVLEYDEIAKGNLETKLTEFIKPFDLGKCPLLRAKLLKVFTDEYYLIIDMHHIIGDALTKDIIFKEFQAIYAGKEIERIEFQYRDYAFYQNEFLLSEEGLRQQEYWLAKYREITSNTDIPKYEPEKNTPHNGDSVELRMEPGMIKKVHELMENSGATLYMVFLAFYSILLSKYFNREDIIVGCDIDGRSLPEFKEMPGMFVNTLALRNFPTRTKRFDRFLEEVKQNILSDFENRAYQFDMLVETLNLNMRNGKNPLFNTMLTLHSLKEVSAPEQVGELEISFYDFKNKVSLFDFSLEVYDYGDTINLVLFYSTDLFEKSEIEKMLKDFKWLIEQGLINPYTKITDMQIESEVLLIENFEADDGDFAF